MNSPSIVVMASAGTGKTFRLTNQYLRLLAAGVPAERIVALTFTRKAAGEILGRVVTRLCDGAGDAGALAQLREHVGDSLTARRCLELLTELASALHKLQIGTIDSFFLRLARGTESLAGLPARWSVTVNPEVFDALAGEAMRRTFAALDEATLRLLRESIGRGPTVQIHRKTTATIGAAAAAYLATSANESAWRGLALDVPRVGEHEARAARDDLFAADLPVNKGGGVSVPWRTAVEKVVRAIDEDELDRLCGERFVMGAFETKGTYHKHRYPDQIARALRTIANYAAGEELERAGQRTRALFFVASVYLRCLDEVSAERGVFGNSQVTSLLSRGDDDALLAMYYGMDARVEHLLIDEFQDTSCEQFAVLLPLIEEILSANDRGALFVGDVKQSLYMWRDAEPALLPAIKRRWTQVGSESLFTSRRSARAVIEAVNRVFSSVSEGSREVAGLDFASAFEAHDTVSDAPGYVCLREAQDADGATIAQEVAARVEHVRSLSPGASVGVLLRRGKFIAPIMHELTRRGLDASAEGGSPLTDSPAVAAAVSLMRLIDSPRERALRFHVATSPLGAALGITPETPLPRLDAVLGDCRLQVAEHGASRFLHGLLARVAPSMSARDADRFEQFIDLALELELHPLGLAVPIWEAAAKREVEPRGAGAVRVMSIHRSKGLEFDAVILADLDTRWSLRGGGVMVDRPDPLGPATRASAFVPLRLEAFSREVRALRSSVTARSIYGETCCLYVGMTRARHALEMIVAPPGKTKDSSAPSAARALRKALVGSGAQSPALFEDGSLAGALSHVRARTPSPSLPELTLSFDGLGARTPDASRAPSASGAPGVNRFAAPVMDHRREIGELWHRWFELIEWLDGGAPDRPRLIEAAGQTGLSRETIEYEATDFLGALAGESVAALLSRARYDATATILRELPFAELRAGELVSGRVDRVVVHDSGSRAEIIDFKTGQEQGSRDVHEVQLRAYRDGVSRLLKVDPACVTCTLVYAREGQIVSVAPATP